MATYLIPRDVTELAEAIKASRLTHAEVGDKAGVTGQFVGRLAAGARARINASAAALIEEALDKPRGSLFRLEEDDDLRPYLPEDAA